MGHDLEESVALLGRTPAVLNALLRGLPDTWTLGNEGENTWSPLDVVGHLIYCERVDWMPRARMVLECGESRAFDPFDRLGHVPLIRGKAMGDLLDEFAGLRTGNMDDLHGMKLGPAQLELRGRHPAFGVVTLSELLATWAVHDLTHLHQISRVMAHQHRLAVGPWSAYLGVMQCQGHSS